MKSTQSAYIANESQVSVVVGVKGDRGPFAASAIKPEDLEASCTLPKAVNALKVHRM